MNKLDDFTVKVWTKDEQIDLRHLVPFAGELKPIELHIKEDGDINDEPSLALILRDGLCRNYVAQISLRMLNTGILTATLIKNHNKKEAPCNTSIS